jgi:small-conductance mechanosensitive channel
MNGRRRWVLAALVMLGLGPSAIAATPVETSASNPHLAVIGILNDVHDAVDRRLAVFAEAPAEASRLATEAADAWRSGDMLRATIYCLVLLMIGGGAEWLYWCYAGKAWRAIAEAAFSRQAPPAARAATLGLRRAALSLFGAATFLGGVLLPCSIGRWPAEVQAGIVGGVLAITAIRVAGIASALILSPHPARLRLVARSDIGAGRLHRGLVALSAALAGGSFAQSFLANTAQAPGLAALASAAGGIVAAGLALVVLRSWPTAPPRHRSSRAALVPILLALLILSCLALHLLGAGQIVVTALLWGAALLAGKVLGALVEAYTMPLAAGAASHASPYRPVMKSAVRMLIFGSATFATISVWNIPLLEIFQSPTLTGNLLAHGLNLAVVILAADLLWVWSRTIIDAKLAALPPRGTADAPDSSARLATLLPLLRKAILVLLLGLAGLTALSALGVDIAPLLAGAGVAGIALGLGAQTLVRDVVSGVFYLLADSFRVGEYVEFGEVRGIVEGISLRFLRIRHPHGAVYTLPFGEIKWLVNHSRDWAVVELEFRVPFETDLAQVAKIVGEIGAEFMAHPKFGVDMIEPLESRGVVRMEELDMVVSVSCVTKPNDGRFNIRRAALHSIRDAFDAHGIRFTHRLAARTESQSEQDPPIAGHGGVSLHEMTEIVHEAQVALNPEESDQSA